MKCIKHVALIWGLVVLALLPPVQAKGQTTEAKSPPKPAVVVVKAARASLTQTVDATGSIEASRLAKLASPAEGPILNCKVREGDLVKPGEILFMIGRAKSAEALLASAAADLRKEQDEARRIEQLVQNGAVPGDQLGISRSNLEKAKAQAAKVKESLEDFKVTAPWPGVISKVLVTDGNFVSPRTPLIELYDPASLVLRFSLPEAQAAQMKIGMPVEYQLDAYPGKAMRAKINRIYPELDRKMRTLTLEAESEGKQEFIPGMFARLTVVTKSVSDATAIPLAALLQNAKGEKTVFVVTQGKAEQRKVEIGIETRDALEVVSGIAPGELVVIEGGEKLKNGVEVKVVESDKAKKQEPGQ